MTKKYKKGEITWEMKQAKQDDILHKLSKELTPKQFDLVKQAINIEYVLAMVEEGHDIENYYDDLI